MLSPEIILVNGILEKNEKKQKKTGYWPKTGFSPDQMRKKVYISIKQYDFQ
jgi:hypothetical protein